MEKGDTDFSRLMKDIMKTKKISMPMITYYWTEMLTCVKDIHEKGNSLYYSVIIIMPEGVLPIGH